MNARCCAGAPAAAGLRAAVAGVLLVLAACDQFSTERVDDTCLRTAMKAGEPYGNDGERHKTEEQLRQYCRSAAQGK
jgi:hypothetical protein